MTLEHVVVGGPHVDAHNAEIDAINALLASIVTQGTLDTILGNYLLRNEKGAASGLASLDGTSKLTASQIPDISATYATLTAMATAFSNFANTFTPPGLIVLGPEDPIPPNTAAKTLIIRTTE